MVINIGLAVSHSSPTVECFITDDRFEKEDIYDEMTNIAILGKIRDMIKFSDGLIF